MTWNYNTKHPYHIWPKDDLIEHDLFSILCVCRPSFEVLPHDELIVEHHALDGREV